jgi:hypothetical protein
MIVEVIFPHLGIRRVKQKLDVLGFEHVCSKSYQRWFIVMRADFQMVESIDATLPVRRGTLLACPLQRPLAGTRSWVEARKRVRIRVCLGSFLYSTSAWPIHRPVATWQALTPSGLRPVGCRYSMYKHFNITILIRHIFGAGQRQFEHSWNDVLLTDKSCRDFS